MKKWIRWQGLAAFAVLAALVSGFWFLFIDSFVKKQIEYRGTTAIGARVELEKADVSLFPAGLALYGLKVTNPDEPMKNAVEIGRAKMSIDGPALIRRKVIIDEMAIDRIRFDTDRKSPGVVKGIQKKKADEKKARAKSLCNKALPSFEFPDIDAVISGRELSSFSLATSYKTKIDELKSSWEKRIAKLPDKKRLLRYQKEINELISGAQGTQLFTRGAELLELKKRFQEDIKSIRNAVEELKRNQADAEKRIDEIKKLKINEAKKLAKEYGISSKELSSISAILFKDSFCNGISKALGWYERIRPYLSKPESKKDEKRIVKNRGKGREVRFAETRPSCDFLIKKATASIILKAGSLSGVIRNITPDQDILGLPMSFSFNGQNLDRIEKISASGILNHINPVSPMDSMRLEIKGYRAERTSLAQNIPLSIKRALINLNLAATAKNNDITADITAEFPSVSFETRESRKTDPVTRALASSLEKVERMTLRAMVRKQADSLKIEISSDIDEILKRAAERIVEEQTKKIRTRLLSAISEKVDPEILKLEKGLMDLGGIKKELAERLKVGEIKPASPLPFGLKP